MEREGHYGIVGSLDKSAKCCKRVVKKCQFNIFTCITGCLLRIKKTKIAE